MSSALQTNLPMRAERISVLLTVYDVRSRLQLNEDEALALARVDWGFDISSGEAKRRELRLLPSTVEYFEQLGRPRPQPAAWDEVKAELTRGAVKTMALRQGEVGYIEGTTVQQILNCSASHFTSFIQCGQLKEVAGTHYTTGPNGTAKVTVESFLRFLKGRKQ